MQFNLFKYDNYRKFLADIIKSEQRANKNSTITKISMSFGLGRSHLHLVLQGKRNLSVESAVKIAKSLNFSIGESSYLLDLVNFNQARNSATKLFFKRKLQKIQEQSIDNTIEFTQEKDLIADWYYPVVLIYIIDNKLSEDNLNDGKVVALIAKKIGISESDISECLHRIKSLLPTDNEMCKKQGSHYMFRALSGKLLLEKYLLSCGQEALKRISLSEEAGTVYRSAAISMDLNQKNGFKEDYLELLQKYSRKKVSYLNKEKETKVYQINLQLFPVV